MSTSVTGCGWCLALERGLASSRRPQHGVRGTVVVQFHVVGDRKTKRGMAACRKKVGTSCIPHSYLYQHPGCLELVNLAVKNRFRRLPAGGCGIALARDTGQLRTTASRCSLLSAVFNSRTSGARCASCSPVEASSLLSRSVDLLLDCYQQQNAVLDKITRGSLDNLVQDEEQKAQVSRSHCKPKGFLKLDRHVYVELVELVKLLILSVQNGSGAMLTRRAPRLRLRVYAGANWGP